MVIFHRYVKRLPGRVTNGFCLPPMGFDQKYVESWAPIGICWLDQEQLLTALQINMLFFVLKKNMVCFDS